MYFAAIRNLSLLSALILLSACSAPTPKSTKVTPEFVLTPPTVEEVESSVQDQVALMLNAFTPVAGQALANESVQEAYASREYKPVWIEGTQINMSIYKLVDILQRADSHGLNPVHYNADAIQEYLAIKEPSSRQLAELDVIATIALSTYAHDLSIGRFEPQLIDPNWQLDAPSSEWSDILMLDNATDMVNYLPSLAPRHPDYQVLQKWLVYYQDIAQKENDVLIAPGVPLSVGDQGPRVAQLRARLVQLGDIRFSTRNIEDDRFDEKLEAALKNFQRRHDLAADGHAGSQTIEMLNVPLQFRARQISYNLERWRWLPAQLEAERIWVDLTDYKLHTFLNDQHNTMKVVIGKKERKTPVFKGLMSYMVANPTWRVPHRIAQEILLPKAHKNPDYLAQNGYRVFSSWTLGASEMDPTQIDWRSIKPRELKYRFEQQPDDGNALGKFKFMFPNRNEIYLHDTPSKHLFREDYRAHSSGCIRLEKPAEFAETLLAGSKKEKDLEKAIATEETTVISLPKKVPVYLVYFTVVPDANGMPEFRNDVYERDLLMEEAMGYYAFADDSL